MNQYENKSLVKIEHVNDKVDTDFYMGKRCATAPHRLISSRPGSEVRDGWQPIETSVPQQQRLSALLEQLWLRRCGKNPWLPPHHGFRSLLCGFPALSGCALDVCSDCGLRWAHLPTIWLSTLG